MANSIGWGQGANNNNIGWGQGVINNNISWGKIYSSSYAGQTDILGGNSYLATFVDAFQTRVVNDSGTFEAYSCLYNSLNGEISQGYVISLAFIDRISADSGIFEAQSCLISFINTLT